MRDQTNFQFVFVVFLECIIFNQNFSIKNHSNSIRRPGIVMSRNVKRIRFIHIIHAQDSASVLYNVYISFYQYFPIKIEQ